MYPCRLTNKASAPIRNSGHGASLQSSFQTWNSILPGMALGGFNDRVREEVSVTVVITGATGMIGSHLYARLTAMGRNPCVLSRVPASVRLPCAVRALPAPDATGAAFEAALAGASHVVHCAALNSDRDGNGEDTFLQANAVLTAKLAKAAALTVPGRFVFLSSTRAMADAGETVRLTQDTPCRPTSPYGRSKLEAERLLREAYDAAERAGAVTLRLPPVYGEGMRGQLGALLRLADTPLPLPMKAYGAPRTLASCRSVVEAIVLLLDHGGALESTYLAGDRASVNAGDILRAFRHGLGRPERLFAAPGGLLRMAAAFARQGKAARLLGAGQTLEPARLAALGWTPEADTPAALAGLAARISRSHAGARRS